MTDSHADTPLKTTEHSARSSGILLHITSLPSRYGIGDLGENAYRFVDFLVQSGQRLWQMLPVLDAGLGNSPYHSSSAFAGNPWMIDPEDLVSMGFLTEDELRDIPEGFSEEQVCYEAVIPWKKALFQKAAVRFFTEYTHVVKMIQAGEAADQARLALFQDFELFTLREKAWLNDYALYNASTTDEVNYYLFIQFIFDRQWSALKRYANKRGVSLIGDIPIYVSPDSVVTWMHPELFQMDENGSLTAVAGVPPDYFAEKGQMWNNPLYDWAGHRDELFDWWIRRIRHQLEHFDILRLDHFRGFESYWAIPAGSEDARSGHWEKGPGIAFFNALSESLGTNLPLIAEDLGDITDDVRALLKETRLPGMKVLQFAFESDESAYQPHRFESANCVCYTGTHDNDTTRGWFEHADEAVRKRVVSYLEKMFPGSQPVDDDHIAEAMIRTALASRADTAIFPMQDLLNLGSEARMNVPGTAADNWRWRFSWGDVTAEMQDKLKDWSCQYHR